MRKSLLCLLVLFACIGLIACGGSVDADTSTIIVEKDGQVKSIIYEESRKDYYSEEELQKLLEEFMAEEVAAYNQQKENAVTVSSVEVVGKKIKVTINFKSAEDYADFNNKTLFYGTIKEAYDAGISLDVTLLDVKDEGNEVGKAQLLEMGSQKIVIFDEALHVRVPGKITHASEALMVSKDNEAASMVEENSYVVLK